MGLGMSALRGEADEDQRSPERPLIAISGPKVEGWKSKLEQRIKGPKRSGVRTEVIHQSVHEGLTFGNLIKGDELVRLVHLIDAARAADNGGDVG